MGDLRPNNGGGMPPDDGGVHRGDLPDFPPEWGTIVIPDDAAELDSEAAALRRELRKRTRSDRLRAVFGLGAVGREGTPLGVPVVIMAVAVITTLLSLFVVTWDHRPSATAPVGPDGAGVAATSLPLASVTLADSAGARVQLANLLPAVLLLTRDCDCAALLATIAKAAPAPVTVIPVGKSAPCPVGTAPNMRCLADPDGAITSRYPAPSAAVPATGAAGPGGTTSPAAGQPAAPPTVTAVLVDPNGTASTPITVDSVDDLTAPMAKLAAGG